MRTFEIIKEIPEGYVRGWKCRKENNLIK